MTSSFNFAFFLFYLILGVLNPLDVFVLTALLVIISAGGYLAKFLYRSFIVYQRSNAEVRQKEYNKIINELEGVDTRGRQTEKELNRITRLYEVTKQFAPVLKFDDFLDALFSLLEENFRFKVTHLLTFNKGEFFRGISKSAGDEDYYKENEDVLDYAGV